MKKTYVGPFERRLVDALCSYYREALKESLPSNLADLLQRLDEPENAYSENQE